MPKTQISISQLTISHVIRGVALAAAVLAAPTAARAQTFDGIWAVDLELTQGDCAERSSIPVRVASGQIEYAGNLDLTASGRIAANGQVQAVFSNGSERVAATGRVIARDGTGTWRAQSRDCAGTWRARRM